MCDESFCTSRRAVLAGVAGTVITTIGSISGAVETSAFANPYTDPANAALPASTMKLDVKRAALVVVDPQIDFMSEKGKSWPVVGESVTEQNLVPNLIRLLQASKRAGMAVAISPHYYYPPDHKWDFTGPAEALQHKLGMFDRTGSLSLEGFAGSGAEFMPEFKSFIDDGETIICSPHKLYGPASNDLVLQLRKRHIDQVILAGMAANLCVESHLRHMLEMGFEVAVVRDAVAAPKIPDGDGYLAALINFRYLANAVWTTEQVSGYLSVP